MNVIMYAEYLSNVHGICSCFLWYLGIMVVFSLMAGRTSLCLALFSTLMAGQTSLCLALFSSLMVGPDISLSRTLRTLLFSNGLVAGSEPSCRSKKERYTIVFLRPDSAHETHWLTMIERSFHPTHVDESSKRYINVFLRPKLADETNCMNEWMNEWKQNEWSQKGFGGD